MNSQKKLLNEYLEISNRPTLKKISSETGIQITRVFRILNGSEMKLKEFEIFKQLILSRKSSVSSFEVLSQQCHQILSQKAIRELEVLMQQKLKLAKLKNDEQLQKSRLMA